MQHTHKNIGYIFILVGIPLVIMILAFGMSNHKNKIPDDFSSEVVSIGVVVSDFQKSLDFYTNVIGMSRTGGFDVDSDFGKRSGLTGGEPFSVAVLKLKDSPTATEWKLMSFGKGSSHPSQSFIQDDTGMQYVTIFVTSLKPFIQRIEKNKVKILGEIPVQLPDGRHFILVQDPDGIFIELIGPLE